MVRGSRPEAGVRQTIVQQMRRGWDGDDHGRWLAQPNLVVPAGILLSGLTGKPRDERPRQNCPEPAVYLCRARACFSWPSDRSPRCATPTDIFQDIRISVIGVVWQYTGLPPDQMSGRITAPFERALTTTVNDIEHIVAIPITASASSRFFPAECRYQNGERPGHRRFPDADQADAPGATPPLILNYNASTVPQFSLTTFFGFLGFVWPECLR